MNFDFFNSRNINTPRVMDSRAEDNILASFRQELQNNINSILDRRSLNRHSEFTLDRFEGDFAVLENRITNQMVDVPIKKIPPNATEGVILRFENDVYTIDIELTERARNEIRDLMNTLRRN